MGVTKKDEKVIDELAKTKTIDALAELIEDEIDSEGLKQLIATIIYFKLKGYEDDEAIAFFIKDQLLYVLGLGAKSIFELAPEILTDPKFLKIITNVYGARFNLKKIMKKKEK